MTDFVKFIESFNRPDLIKFESAQWWCAYVLWNKQIDICKACPRNSEYKKDNCNKLTPEDLQYYYENFPEYFI